jgi:hypothetical protein
VTVPGDLPTDDDRPERRRRLALIGGSVAVTLLIAAVLVASAKPNTELHPVAAATTTTTAPSGDYTSHVAAANATLNGLLDMTGGWQTTLSGLQTTMGSVTTDSKGALAALLATQAAHRAKPQVCATVDASASQTQSLVTSLTDTTSGVTTSANQLLADLTQAQSQLDQLNADIAAASASADPAQKSALESLQVSSSAMGVRISGFSQSATSWLHKAITATTSAHAVAAQAAAIPPLCKTPVPKVKGTTPTSRPTVARTTVPAPG